MNDAAFFWQLVRYFAALVVIVCYSLTAVALLGLWAGAA